MFHAKHYSEWCPCTQPLRSCLSYLLCTCVLNLCDAFAAADQVENTALEHTMNEKSALTDIEENRMQVAQTWETSKEPAVTGCLLTTPVQFLLLLLFLEN